MEEVYENCYPRETTVDRPAPAVQRVQAPGEEGTHIEGERYAFVPPPPPAGEREGGLCPKCGHDPRHAGEREGGEKLCTTCGHRRLVHKHDAGYCVAGASSQECECLAFTPRPSSSEDTPCYLAERKGLRLYLRCGDGNNVARVVASPWEATRFESRERCEKAIRQVYANKWADLVAVEHSFASSSEDTKKEKTHYVGDGCKGGHRHDGDPRNAGAIRFCLDRIDELAAEAERTFNSFDEVRAIRRFVLDIRGFLPSGAAKEEKA